MLLRKRMFLEKVCRFENCKKNIFTKHACMRFIPPPKTTALSLAASARIFTSQFDAFTYEKVINILNRVVVR